MWHGKLEPMPSTRKEILSELMTPPIQVLGFFLTYYLRAA